MQACTSTVHWGVSAPKAHTSCAGHLLHMTAAQVARMCVPACKMALSSCVLRSCANCPQMYAGQAPSSGMALASTGQPRQLRADACWPGTLLRHGTCMRETAAATAELCWPSTPVGRNVLQQAQKELHNKRSSKRQQGKCAWSAQGRRKSRLRPICFCPC